MEENQMKPALTIDFSKQEAKMFCETESQKKIIFL